MNKIFNLNTEAVQNRLSEFAVNFSLKLLTAIVLFVIGILIVKLIRRLVGRAFNKAQLEPSLRTFVLSLISFLLYASLLVVVGSTIGIQTSSFVAIIGAAGLAIGLALQGSLANFAGGVLILIFKPFKVDDLVKVKDVLGRVIKIDILYTRLRTFDNRIITIPNGTMANSEIDNRTMESTRRVDMVLRISYQTDIKQVRELVIKTLSKHPKALDNPAPDMWVDELRDFDIKIAMRCWAPSEEFWPVYWDQLESVKEALDNAGIKIPIPRQDVYLRKGSTED